MREVQASHVPKRYILGTVFQRGVGRPTNPLPAKVMANQLRIVQLKARLEDTGRRSTKERVNGKSSGAKWFSATLAELAKCLFQRTNKNSGPFRQVSRGCYYTNKEGSRGQLGKGAFFLQTVEFKIIVTRGMLLNPPLPSFLETFVALWHRRNGRHQHHFELRRSCSSGNGSEKAPP